MSICTWALLPTILLVALYTAWAVVFQTMYGTMGCARAPTCLLPKILSNLTTSGVVCGCTHGFGRPTSSPCHVPRRVCRHHPRLLCHASPASSQASGLEGRKVELACSDATQGGRRDGK
ncbi:hypothetical protein BCR44DRAFT_1101798 [Catenaria anguillulae PL171]|uniref:Uncharacterized protein n=1 Tax=Catenaria anguillulae PL171 TaxID=765915 RepID=A0A1Y2I206_9FUNG|nr:hypothetical protein BCR44DRAFT_1101798 [Catenaria anguillulae PL171]